MSHDHLDVDGQRLVGTLLDEHLAGGGLAVAAVHHALMMSERTLRSLELGVV